MKKNIVKLLSVALIICMMYTLCACGDKSKKEPSGKKETEVTAESEPSQDV